MLWYLANNYTALIWFTKHSSTNSLTLKHQTPTPTYTAPEVQWLSTQLAVKAEFAPYSGQKIFPLTLSSICSALNKGNGGGFPAFPKYCVMSSKILSKSTLAGYESSMWSIDDWIAQLSFYIDFYKILFGVTGVDNCTFQFVVWLENSYLHFLFLFMITE